MRLLTTEKIAVRILPCLATGIVTDLATEMKMMRIVSDGRGPGVRTNTIRLVRIRSDYILFVLSLLSLAFPVTSY